MSKWRSVDPKWAAAGATITLLLGGSLLLAIDVDADAESTWAELRQGTRPWSGDSDGDGLEDGWERREGLDALRADSEGDGIADGTELRLGADPLSRDSDGDGLFDLEEAGLGDCDEDGVRAIAEGDGDGDGRLDALEAGPDRCVRDADGDGVPDGSEGNARCVHAPDCDLDGLPDGAEDGSFDALDPDSFGSGVSDSISYAFEESGQPPGADADDDGIPDGWEGEDGLIAWGELRPRPGERDLLVEFVRVQGPDSGRPRYDAMSFAPAYRFVADMLRNERDVRLRWVETIVEIDDEMDPALVPTLDDPYYADVLQRAAYSGNPYVTTVVLNPQHDQGTVLHAGVAPIRGMLAAVDYGAHVAVHFANATGTRLLTLQPIVESLIRGGRGDTLADMGFEGGYTRQGEMGLRSIGDGDLVIWEPSWFRGPPRIVAGQQSVQLRFDGVTVYHGSLAGTILHELGHTLGLCHAHDSDCNARFSAADRADQEESTMSYDAPGNRLHFLDSEWATVLQYISCPPDGPIRIVAEGGGADEVLQDKYGYANRNVLAVDLRECNDLTPLPRQFEPGIPPAGTYEAPATWADPADDPEGKTWSVVAVASVAVLAVVMGLAVGRWASRRRAT